MPTKRELLNQFQTQVKRLKNSGVDTSQYERQVEEGMKSGKHSNLDEEVDFQGVGQTQQPTQPTQAPNKAAFTNNPEMDALIKRALAPRNAGQSVGNAMSILGGGSGVNGGGDDYSKLYAQEAIKKSFVTDEEKLIQRAKAIEAAKSTGNRALYDSLVGNQGQPQPNQPTQPQGNSTGFEAPEIDPFTGKPSSRGVEQEYNNKMLEQKGIQDIKSKTPTAKQKDDLANIGNVETLLLNMERDSAQVPSGYKGLASQARGFFTRGATDTNTVVYNDQRKAVAVAVYRALTGDTRLSDADAANRALPLLWKPDESQEVKTMKFSKLRQLLSDRKNMVSQNIGGEEEVQDPNDFSQMSDEQLQQIASSG